MGQAAKKNGQAKAQARSTPPVPTRRWRGGNTINVQRACEMPPAPRNMEIWKGEKP
jgi:hypothetical protein